MLKMRFAAVLVIVIILIAPFFTLSASADAPIGCRGALSDLDECLSDAEEV